MKKTSKKKDKTKGKDGKVKKDFTIETLPLEEPIKVIETPKLPLTDGGRKQISHTLPLALLEKIDERANRMGFTRASFINYALSDFVNK
jgi:hypothetical protein